MTEKTSYRPFLLAALLLLCLTLLACGMNQDLVGVWKLTVSEEASFAVGSLFEFKADRSLEIRLGDAQVSSEDRDAFEEAYGNADLSYTTSPDGSITLTISRQSQGRTQLPMTYVLEEDRLEITDEDGVSLIFQRQSKP